MDPQGVPSELCKCTKKVHCYHGRSEGAEDAKREVCCRDVLAATQREKTLYGAFILLFETA